MLIQFQEGKSYLWLSCVHGLLMIAAMIAVIVCNQPGAFFVVMPLSMLHLLICELYSEIAVDSWMKAAHPKSGRLYRWIILWHIFGVIFSTAFAGLIAHVFG